MKRVLCAVLTALLWSQGMPAAHAAEPVKPASSGVEVSAKSVILMERETGTVLYQQAEHEQREPASVTKIMTMLLVVEAIEQGQLHLEDRVTCSAYAASMGGSQVFLEPGETQTVETMIKCISVASANDACVCMAEYICGNEQEFVNQMNERAKGLGMENTHFVNCNGLDAEGHVTTARDIALMSRELIHTYPQIFDYCNIWMEDITHTTKKGSTQFGLTNTNKMIRQYEYATGLKTGSTSQAKFCISATARKDNTDMIAVIMAVGTVLCLTIPSNIISLFTTNAETVKVGASALKIISAGFVVSAVSVTSCGALEALNKGKESLVISLCRYVVIIVPCAFLLSKIVGANGVWNTFWITEALTAVISFVVYKKSVKLK